MSETVLEEYGFKASMMAPGQMQAAERMAAECATLRARVAELEAEARVKRISAPPPPPRSRPMPEHGLTTGEATARLCGIVRSLHYYGDPPDPRLRADVDADVQAVVDAAYTLADTLCARHLREAVTERGVTEQEVEAFRQAVDAGQFGPGCGCDNIGYTCDACYRRGLDAVATLARAEERERCRAAVEEIGIREAGHGHSVSVGSYARATDEDFEVAKRWCHYCLRVEVLHEAVQAIDALTPTPEPPHA